MHVSLLFKASIEQPELQCKTVVLYMVGRCSCLASRLPLMSRCHPLAGCTFPAQDGSIARDTYRVLTADVLAGSVWVKRYLSERGRTLYHEKPTGVSSERFNYLWLMLFHSYGQTLCRACLPRQSLLAPKCSWLDVWDRLCTGQVDECLTVSTRPQVVVGVTRHALSHALALEQIHFVCNSFQALMDAMLGPSGELGELVTLHKVVCFVWLHSITAATCFHCCLQNASCLLVLNPWAIHWAQQLSAITPFPASCTCMY